MIPRSPIRCFGTEAAMGTSFAFASMTMNL